MVSDGDGQESIKKDIIAKKLGKQYNNVIVLFYKIKSLGEDKRLRIEMSTDIFDLLLRFGIDFDDFSKGGKLFEDNREEFMNLIEDMRAKADIVDILSNKNFYKLTGNR